MTLKDRIDGLFNEIVSYEDCPICLERIERLEVEKLVRFLVKEKLSTYNKPPNLYTPLDVFDKIRNKYKKYQLLMQPNDKNIKNLKKELKKKYKTGEQIASFNQNLIDNIHRCHNSWKRSSKQDAINIYNSLVLCIYACDFYKLPHPKSIFDNIAEPS